MYNCQINIKVIFVLCLISIFWIGIDTFWFDLSNELSSLFQKWKPDSYMETAYQSNYSKDPFKDELEDIENMSMQVKMAWVDYIEKIIKQKNCSLSRKKIQSILYYYVKDFKEDLMKNLKEGLWEYDSSKFVMDEDKVESYCKDIYYCVEYGNRSSFWDYRSKVVSDLKEEKITSSTPSHILSWCKEAFKRGYEEWQMDQQNKQQVEVSWLWSDKYWNSTTDDSPYDIMVDFWNIWKILYTDVQQPVTPVFYNLPMFSNSKKSMQNSQSQGKSSDNSLKSGNDWNNKGQSSNTNETSLEDSAGDQWHGGDFNDWGNTDWNNVWSSTNPTPLPFSYDVWWLVDEDIYDDLVEWLWSSSILQSNSLYYWSLCDPSEEEPEPTSANAPTILSIIENDENFEYDLSDVSVEEFEELVDYVKWAVDKYTSLPESKKEEIRAKAWDTSSFVNDVTPSQIEATAKRIKNCYSSCEWLRADQYASCVIMCTCWEIDSPIFNPETTPWLWPIFKIRFCAVPGVNNKFSVWWKRIISIEEGVKEIYGVVDKLSREWKLWMWTQQYNFLDSSTKKMNMANTIAFSIDIEFVDMSDNEPKHSQQYEEKKAESRNKTWQRSYHIANDLDNPVLKNKYRIISNWNITKDFSATANADWARQSENNLNTTQSLVNDPGQDSSASRYSNLSQILSRWLDQQWNLWIQTYDYINQLDEDARMLYSKKW